MTTFDATTTLADMEQHVRSDMELAWQYKEGIQEGQPHHDMAPLLNFYNEHGEALLGVMTGVMDIDRTLAAHRLAQEPLQAHSAVMHIDTFGSDLRTNPLTGKAWKKNEITELHARNIKASEQTWEAIISCVSYRDGRTFTYTRPYHYDGDQLVWDDAMAEGFVDTQGRIATTLANNWLKPKFKGQSFNRALDLPEPTDEEEAVAYRIVAAASLVSIAHLAATVAAPLPPRLAHLLAAEAIHDRIESTGLGLATYMFGATEGFNPNPRPELLVKALAYLVTDEG